MSVACTPHYIIVIAKEIITRSQDKKVSGEKNQPSIQAAKISCREKMKKAWVDPLWNKQKNTAVTFNNENG